MTSLPNPSDFPRHELEAAALELARGPDPHEISGWVVAALLADATPRQLEKAAKLLDTVAAKAPPRDLAAVEAAAEQLRGKREEKWRVKR